jgi:hypothetical protein
VGEPPPGSPREEAERLVITALAAFSMATRGWVASRGDGHRVATGSGECCACPVCRALTAIQDPSPELVERLATGAADVATGVTSVLRAFGSAFGRPEPEPAQPAKAGGSTGPGDPWRAATAGAGDVEYPDTPA